MPKKEKRKSLFRTISNLTGFRSSKKDTSRDSLVDCDDIPAPMSTIKEHNELEEKEEIKLEKKQEEKQEEEKVTPSLPRAVSFSKRSRSVRKSFAVHNEEKKQEWIGALSLENVAKMNEGAVEKEKDEDATSVSTVSSRVSSRSITMNKRMMKRRVSVANNGSSDKQKKKVSLDQFNLREGPVPSPPSSLQQTRTPIPPPPSLKKLSTLPPPPPPPSSSPITSPVSSARLEQTSNPSGMKRLFNDSYENKPEPPSPLRSSLKEKKEKEKEAEKEEKEVEEVKEAEVEKEQQEQEQQQEQQQKEEQQEQEEQEQEQQQEQQQKEEQQDDFDDLFLQEIDDKRDYRVLKKATEQREAIEELKNKKKQHRRASLIKLNNRWSVDRTEASSASTRPKMASEQLSEEVEARRRGQYQVRHMRRRRDSRRKFTPTHPPGPLADPARRKRQVRLDWDREQKVVVPLAVRFDMDRIENKKKRALERGVILFTREFGSSFLFDREEAEEDSLVF